MKNNWWLLLYKIGIGVLLGWLIWKHLSMLGILLALFLSVVLAYISYDRAYGAEINEDAPKVTQAVNDIKALDDGETKCKLVFADTKGVYVTGWGEDTIVISYSMAKVLEDYSLNTVRGVLLHEYGHILLGHSFYRKVNAIANAFSVLFLVTNSGVGIINLILLSIGLLLLYFKKTGRLEDTEWSPLVFSVVKYIVTVLDRKITASVYRNQEYEADNVAKDFGYGEDLAEILDSIAEIEGDEYSSHPQNIERTRRLRV